ncbi:hypothetical protein GCM10027360_85960 [Amycolatopsis echigonensis]
MRTAGPKAAQAPPMPLRIRRSPTAQRGLAELAGPADTATLTDPSAGELTDPSNAAGSIGSGGAGGPPQEGGVRQRQAIRRTWPLAGGYGGADRSVDGGN